MGFSPGDALFIPSGPKGDHLFMITHGPKKLNNYGDNDQFLLVPICTVIPGVNHELILPVGCHPFVKHESYADFRYAQIRSDTELSNNHMFRPHPNRIDESILAMIIQMLPRSTRLPRFVKKDFLGQ